MVEMTPIYTSGTLWICGYNSFSRILHSFPTLDIFTILDISLIKIF